MSAQGARVAFQNIKHSVVSMTIIGDKKIQLEVAQTPEKLAKGLKFRKELRADTGMVFELGKSVEKAPFWIKDVHIPLDILFLQDGVVKTIMQNTLPCPKGVVSLVAARHAMHNAETVMPMPLIQ